MPAPETFRCSSCGDEFSLSPSVRQKYPNWTPKTCMNCRGQGSSNGNGSARRRRGNSATRNGNLSPQQVLERFTEGPQDGIFTDGSCQGNPGPGGWGAVYVRGGRIVEERSGYDPATTNNRMELTAMIEGLSMVGPEEAVDVYSDSELVVNTVTKWAKGWEARGWKRKEGEVKNLDLVREAYALAKERPLARIQWIRAHDGSRWNEYADALSTSHLRTE